MTDEQKKLFGRFGVGLGLVVILAAFLGAQMPGICVAGAIYGIFFYWWQCDKAQCVGALICLGFVAGVVLFFSFLHSFGSGERERVGTNEDPLGLLSK